MAKILLNKENLFYNLSVISEHTKSKEKVAIVLKDNAYGHGIIEIAIGWICRKAKEVDLDLPQRRKDTKYTIFTLS